ncbi:MAG: hypothetical protein R3E87_23580 [Burkholderiaceae bacterium]
MTKPADLTTSDDRLFAAAAFLEPIGLQYEDRLMHESVVAVRADAPLDLLAVTAAARANYAADLVRYFYDRVDHVQVPEVSLVLPAIEAASKLSLELATRLAALRLPEDSEVDDSRASPMKSTSA